MVKLSIFKVSFSNLPVSLNIIILVFFSLIVSPHLSEYLFNLCKLQISPCSVSDKINKSSAYIRQFSLCFPRVTGKHPELLS